MNETELLQHLAEHLGATKFNKLVKSASTAREKGRFAFWQQQLLDGFAGEAGCHLPDGFDATLALLESAEPLPIEFSREEFFENPVAAWMTPEAEFPADWISEAVQDVRFREHLAYELARSASKVGDFALASERSISALTSSLRESQVLDLYVYIRDVSNRLEEEWRPEFESVFGVAVDDPASLPARSELMPVDEIELGDAEKSPPEGQWWEFWK